MANQSIAFNEQPIQFYWIYCSLKWMPDHAKEYTFDVIEFTMRANESCLNFARC